MAHVVCQVLHKPDRLTFLWSEGQASFEPYHLSGADAEQFQALARDAAAALARTLREGKASSGLELAAAGRTLYDAMFRADAGDNTTEHKVRSWLAAQTVESLEILSDAPGTVPWNVVYDQPASAALDPTGFWGIRYNLAGGRRVNPLRLNPLLTSPEVLALGPVDVTLPENVRRVDHTGDLLQSVGDHVPDILCLWASFTNGRLDFGDAALGLDELRAAIDNALAGTPEPLLLVHPLDETGWDDFLRQASALFPGLITWQAPATRADGISLGSRCLEKILVADQPIAAALRQLRQSEGLSALALASFAPAPLRIAGSDAAPPLVASVEYELPPRPFHPLAPLEEDAAPLLVGRDQAVYRFTGLLDRADTRLLVLTGAAAVGKSSFLRAGIVPYLQNHSVGLHVLRAPSETPGEPVPVLVLRASADLAGQLAEGLCAFAAQPLQFTTPAGATVVVPLPGLLQQALEQQALEPQALEPRRDALAHTSASRSAAPPPLPPTTAIAEPGHEPALESAAPDAVTLWKALQNDTTLLARVLDSLTVHLPFELVVLVEQVEELFTLGRDVDDDRLVPGALAMLANVAQRCPGCKIVLAMRQEYLANLLDDWPGDRGSLRSFTLQALEQDQLEQIILLPTQTEPLPFTTDIPAQAYGLAFADNFPAELTREVKRVSSSSGVAVLPLLHAVCARLHERARRRPGTPLGRADLRAVGGVEGVLNRFLPERVRALASRKYLQNDLRTLLHRLVQPTSEGTPTRRLLALAEARRNLSHASPEEADALLENAAADNAPLLRVDPLLVEGRENYFVSLASDAAAQFVVHAEHHKLTQRYARSKVIDVLFITIPLMFLTGALGYYLTSRHYAPLLQEAQRSDAEGQRLINRVIAADRFTSYVGHVAQAHEHWQNGNLVAMRQALLTQQFLPLTAFGKQFEDPEQRETDLRGFEWFYLWHLANSQRYLLSGHLATVTALAASPDGQLLASASANGRLKIWNLATGKVRAELLPIPAAPAIHALAFSGDGKFLASAGADHTIHVWDAGTGADKFAYLQSPLQKLTGHTAPIHALAFHDNTLASASADKSVMVWNLDKSAPRHQLQHHSAPVLSLAFSADGKTLASGGADKHIVLWDPAAGKKTASIDAHGKIAALVFSHDGATLASAGEDVGPDGSAGIIRFWDPATQKPRFEPLTHARKVFALAFAPDGKTLFSAGKDNVIRLWEPAKSQPLGVIKGHLGWVSALTLSSGGAALASGSYDGDVRVWTPHPTRDHDIVHAGSEPVTQLALAPDDSHLAWAGKDGVVHLYDLKARNKLTPLKKQDGEIVGLAFARTQKGPRLAVASRVSAEQGTIKVWNLKFEGDEVLFTLPAKNVHCVALTGNGQTLASSDGKDVVLWELATGKPTATLKGHEDLVRCLAFSSDGLSLISGGNDSTLRHWSVPHGKESADSPLRGHSAPVLAVAFVRDQFIFSTSADQTFRFWHVGDGKLLNTVLAHHGPVRALVWHKGEFLTAGDDHLIKSWNPFSSSRFTFRGHTGPVRGLVLTGDLLTLASASDDGTVRLWRAARPQDVYP